LHVDLASLMPGRGPDGIVTREDVLVETVFRSPNEGYVLAAP
jgi:pyruvate dehydrogenase E2 component (dihydrolipoamide acetyltransferase)